MDDFLQIINGISSSSEDDELGMLQPTPKKKSRLHHRSYSTSCAVRGSPTLSDYYGITHARSHSLPSSPENAQFLSAGDLDQIIVGKPPGKQTKPSFVTPEKSQTKSSYSITPKTDEFLYQFPTNYSRKVIGSGDSFDDLFSQDIHQQNVDREDMKYNSKLFAETYFNETRDSLPTERDENEMPNISERVHGSPLGTRPSTVTLNNSMISTTSSFNSLKEDKELNVFENDMKGRPMLSNMWGSMLRPSGEYEKQSEQGHYYSGHVLLSLPEDEFTLNELHCFIRQNVEAFTATYEDVAARHSKGVQKLLEGQVGIRCIHCKDDPPKDRANQAVSYPSTISGISQTAFDMQRHHFGSCKRLTNEVRKKFFELKASSYRKRSSRWYWIDAAKKLGLVDTPYGIRFNQEPSILKKQRSNSKNSGFAVENEDFEPLVRPEDKPLITDFLELVMQQMRPCELTEECGRHTNLSIGFPGLACKWCCGPGGFGKYFPSTPATLKDNNTATRFYLHMIKCRRCPQEIKDKLEILQKDHAKQSTKLKLGSKKKFFNKVWNRLHKDSNRIVMDDDDSKVPSGTGNSDDVRSKEIANNNNHESIERELLMVPMSEIHNVPTTPAKALAALEEIDDWLKQVEFQPV